MKPVFSRPTLIFLIVTLLFFNSVYPQTSSNSDTLKISTAPVVLDNDTLFNIYSGIGTFTASDRANEIGLKLEDLVKRDSIDYEAINAEQQNGIWVLTYSGKTIMGITPEDARSSNTEITELVQNYRSKIISELERIRGLYSNRSLIENGLYSLLYLVLLVAFFWLSTKIFPWLYKKTGSLAGKKIHAASIKGKEIIRSSSIVSSIIVLLQGLRLALSLYAVYLFIFKTITLWPHMRKWDIEPILKGVVLFIFYSIVFLFIAKGLNALVKYLTVKYDSWKGAQIKSIKLKSIEILSEEKAVEILRTATNIIRFAFLLILFYAYITVAFSLFNFSQNWASTLLLYVWEPLKSVLSSFINFLPNLFFIIVLVFVFRYLIKFVKFIFLQIDRGSLSFPGFHEEWAIPTYKIVRFMIIILAVIIIFPYLPGSKSPFFQGISIFVGILFSFGSSSAISNVVSGVVLTYMRPFKIGDRVKIAETTGDVIEKTLLVTRVRTIKNVDITIPNSMVLGSHIINFSSSAKDLGLILHTSVTIGYDVPWKKVHELLLAAAAESESVLKEPAPFVLQTSLDDSYVSYELNAYTNTPANMSKIYSQLHSKIQDKFNEAGIEIMSPHYSAVRDGNKITVPEDYLPKEYKAPPFRIFGVNLFGKKDD